MNEATGLPERWRYNNGWPMSDTRLGDEDVAKIREILPFGPLSLDEVESHALAHSVNPVTILNIASGRSYKRPKACPEGHPLRLALNEALAAKERLRYQAQNHRQTVGDAQDWKCKFCGVDVSGKGKSALDHIIPVAQGGTSDKENLQILCRRCNIRKSDKTPDARLDQYMERKVSFDRVIDKANKVLPPIVDSVLWMDTQDAQCPWCNSETRVVQSRETWSSAVWQCSQCQKLFRVGMGEQLWAFCEQEYFYSGIQSAIFDSQYADDEAHSLLRSLMADDLARVHEIVRQAAGSVEEVKKLRHWRGCRNGTAACWCMLGDDEYEVLGIHSQSAPMSTAKRREPSAK